MAELDGECDFVTDVAVHYPLYVILSLLGLPEEDFPRMLKLTQELFGTVGPGARARQRTATTCMATLLDFFEYFQGLIEDRRAHPRPTTSRSVIANAEIDGEAIGTAGGRSATTSSSRPPATTPRARRSRAGCTR